MEVLNDILGYKNRKIFQDNELFMFSLDSIMLANFVSIRLRDKLICDLGCGNGIIPLLLSLKTDKQIIGVDIQEIAVNLAKKSIEYNKLNNQIKIYNEDIKKFCDSEFFESFDLITSNPPYFKVNSKNYFNENYSKTISRHEVMITLDELIFSASKLLKNNGNFCLVHRTERLVEIINTLKKYKLEPKRIQFVYENINKESTLVLIEAQKNGKTGLKIERPFILYEADGKMTNEYLNMQTEMKI